MNNNETQNLYHKYFLNMLKLTAYTKITA